ncbi:hypothetical protein O7983_000741 [Mycoplasmopsis felis]|uniref:hypothetical protein n=1 Tax=Mycoplasmopsis felis TaxID=33923 RepID=UPI003A4E4A5B
MLFFNIVIPDISLTGLKAEAKEYLFKHTKKLTIISYGNAQLNKFIQEYFEYINKKEQSIEIEDIKS